MNPVYLHNDKDPAAQALSGNDFPVLSRTDFVFYSFPLPPIPRTELREYLLLRIKPLYPGNITASSWFYYVQGQAVFVIIMTPESFARLKDRGLLGRTYLPAACRKKYPWPGKFDMLIEYPDCYELASIENHCLNDSHVFAKGSGDQAIEERLGKALDRFSCSEKLFLCLSAPLPKLESSIQDNYSNTESISSAEFFAGPLKHFYKLESKAAKSFPVPRSVRIAFYLLLALFFSYLAFDDYLSAKEKIVFSQNNKIRQLEALKTDTDKKLVEIEEMEAELKLMRDREGSNVHSFLSALASEMKGAKIYTITLSGRDFELTGIHDNPLILVDTINKGELFKTMKLRSSVPDPDSGKQFFSISGSLK